MRTPHDEWLDPIDAGDARCAKCGIANLDNPSHILEEACQRWAGTNWEICTACCVSLPDEGEPSCEDCEALVASLHKIPEASDAPTEAAWICTRQDPAASVPTTSTGAAGQPKRGAA